MQQVLEHLREKQRDLGGSSFIRFLQDARFSPQDRLSFLSCLAPFILGFADLERALQGDAPRDSLDSAAPHESPHWAVYLQDLQVLGLGTTTDFAGMLRLLWGPDSSLTRRTLYELIDLATGANPVSSHVLTVALNTVGSVMLGALAPIACAFETRTGKRLVGIHFMRAQFERASRDECTVELDLRPGQEQDALRTIDEVFSLVGELGEHLLAHVQRRIDVKRAQFTWEPPSRLTFQEFGTARIQTLCDAVGYAAEDTETVKRFFTFMTNSWGSRRIGPTPPWRSDITDDHTPFELSLALEGGRPEVRFLMESQSSTRSHHPAFLLG